MTKKMIAKMISSRIDYIDSLSFFARYLMQFETEEEAENALYELDDKAWSVATTDAKQDRWLQVFSALQCAL